MDVLDGRITCVFLGSSRHKIIGSVKKKKLQTSFIIISNIQILCGVWGVGGWRLGHRRSCQDVVLDDFVLYVWIRRLCGSCVEKKNSVDLSHLEIE